MGGESPSEAVLLLPAGPAGSPVRAAASGAPGALSPATGRSLDCRGGTLAVATVVLLGTLDTKGQEYDFLREQVQAAGCDVILVDAGDRGPATGRAPDITADEVARAAGEDRAALAAAGDRGAAVAAMGRGGGRRSCSACTPPGACTAVLGMGGSGGSSLIGRAVRDLPIGSAQAPGVHGGLGQHPGLRGHLGRHHDVPRGRHRRHQCHLGAGAGQRRGRRRRHGPALRRLRAAGLRQAAARRHHVRQHHSLRGRPPGGGSRTAGTR